MEKSYIDAYRLVLDFFCGDKDKAKLWMETPNPLLGGISPSDMVKAGRGDRLHKFIKQALLDNQPPEHRPLYADTPDAYVCRRCGLAYSTSMFNCQCGYMDCGHPWRTGGEMRDACQPCVNELLGLRDAVGKLIDKVTPAGVPINSPELLAVMEEYRRLTRKH